MESLTQYQEDIRSSLEIVSAEFFSLLPDQLCSKGQDTRAKIGDLVQGLPLTKSRMVQIQLPLPKVTMSPNPLSLSTYLVQVFRTLFREIEDDSKDIIFVCSLPIVQFDDAVIKDEFVVVDPRTGLAFLNVLYSDRLIVGTAWGVK